MAPPQEVEVDELDTEACTAIERRSA